MYIYVPSQLHRKIEDCQLQDEITRLSNFVNDVQEISGLRGFLEPMFPYWIRRASKLRIVGKVVRVGDDRVLCLLDVLERKGKAYEEFRNQVRQFKETRLDQLLNESQVTDWLSKEKEQKRAVQPIPLLPPEFSPWLEPPGWGAVAEGRFIYESEEWVMRIRWDDISRYRHIYHDMILQIVEGRSYNSQKLRSWPGLWLAPQDGRYLLFGEFETAGTGDLPSQQVLFLVAPFAHEPSEEERDEIVKQNYPLYASDVTAGDQFTKELTIDKLAPFAKRAYPDYILYDYDAWYEIQEEKEANLALSPEEQQILRQVSVWVPGGKCLPLFINGRAGSGKSTMLFYLFADYCHRKHRQNLPGDPLFITYSDRLLEVAKNAVGHLLRSHYRFRAERVKGEEIPHTDAYFHPFQKFLVGLLPANEQDRFEEEKHMSFVRFKRLHAGHPLSQSLPQHDTERQEVQQERELVCNLPEAKKWSPELCWHVIRTFIKGYRLDKFMGTDDYLEIPRKERTVSEETFRGIYTSIWERWYEPITIEQGYWDDQDLVRRVVELGCYSSEHTAIFCDEAQDFTRLELQLILRLSVFCRYALGYQPIYSLPFAFAGDPLQTVNPTGFRWPALQAAFYDEVITALDAGREQGVDLNFQELAYNYRSVPSIVRLGNLILLWRHVLFDLPELMPQQSWWKGGFFTPVKFILDKHITVEELKDIAKDTMIIVPSEQDQENSYVQNDPVLSQLIPEVGEGPPKNVLSPVSAKGLEFQRVVLYKFGEACDEAVWRLMSNCKAAPSVEAEYFFNKLYVAATRATKYLFIVDSEVGDQRLWQNASTDQLNRFVEVAEDPSVWKEHVGSVSVGIPEDKREMREINPLANAEELRRKGLDLRDAGLLRRAKQYYQAHGSPIDVDLCEAWALKLEGQFQEAGKMFLRHEKPDEAWECFWEGMCWAEVEKWHVEHLGRKPEEVHALAVFMLQQPDNLNGIKDFTKILQRCIEERRLKSPLRKQWKTAVKEYVSRLSNLTEGVLKQDEWQEVGETLEGLAGAGYSGALDLAGTSFYRASNWHGAMRCWEAAGITEKEDYLLAKSKVVGLPDGLQYLEKAHRRDLIIEEWKTAGGLDTATGEKWLRYVVPALEEKGQYLEAFQVYRRAKNTAKEKECFAKASESLSQQDLWESLESLVSDLRRPTEWLDAIDVMGAYFPRVEGRDADKVRLQAHLASELAYSDRMPDDFQRYRKRYVGFIQDMLSRRDCYQYVSVKEVGSALERIGDLAATGRFYEKFVDDPDADLRRFARERWIIAMRKLEDQYKKKGDERKREQTSQKLGRQAEKWQIRRGIELPLYPELGTEVVPVLPPGTKVEQLGGGDLRFLIGNIEVTVSKARHVIQITDTRSWQPVQVDFQKKEIRAWREEEVQVEHEGDELQFRVQASGYAGRAVFAGKARLELWTERWRGTIVIEL